MTDDKLAALKASDFYGDDLGASLRRTLCNLLRVARGGGRSYEVTRNLLETAGTLQNYRRRHDHDVPAWEIEGLLNVRRQSDPMLSPERQHQEDALDLIICGALQMAASRWTDDYVRAGLGWDELARGIEDLVGVRPTRL